MLKTAKRTVLTLLRSTGAFDRVADSVWRRERLLILCYHSVSLEQEHLWNPSLFFHPDVFERRLDLLLAHGCNVLPLSEALERLYSRTLPPRSVVLTFDDGTCDFAGLVAPLLHARSLPATLFLTSYYSQARRPVFDLMCAYLLWKGRRCRLAAAPQLGWHDSVDLRTRVGRQSAWQRLLWVAESWGLSVEEKDGLARHLAAQVGVDYDALLRRRVLQIMSPEEVAQVARLGIDVQLHTHRHRCPRDRQRFFREILENRQYIENCTGTRPAHLCYPSGAYFPEMLPWLRALAGGI
jgi:peptidoglycan/xylan/chitin deacetylase (PgdA/CDA1 family)